MIPLGILASSSAPSWTPALLSQVWLWLTAGPTWCFSDAGGTVPCANGDTVKVWKDQSSNAHHLNTASLGFSAFPTMTFSGGQWRVSGNTTLSQCIGRASITTWPSSVGFASSRFRITGTGDDICSLDLGSGGNPGGEFYRFNGDGNAYWQNFMTSRVNAPFATVDSIATHTYTQTSDTDARAYIDGSQVGSTLPANWSSPTIFNLMATNLGTSTMDIAGVVVGASTLTSGNRALLEAYLAGLLT